MSLAESRVHSAHGTADRDQVATNRFVTLRQRRKMPASMIAFTTWFFVEAAIATTPIRTLPGFDSLTVLEQTGVIKTHSFSLSSVALATRAETLDLASADFLGGGGKQEYYDAFYSDSSGSPDVDGLFVTIEVLYAGDDGGGNINDIRLNRPGGGFERPSVVARVRSFGLSAIPGSVSNAIDADVATTTFLGSSTDQNDRLSITVGFPRLTSCAADFNADGFIDFTDFDDFVTSFEAGDPAADFNDDGFLTFEDFDAFVAEFEAGC